MQGEVCCSSDKWKQSAMWIIADKGCYQQKHNLMTWTCVSSVSGTAWGHNNCVHTINNKVQKSTFFLYMKVHFGGGGGEECAIGNLQEKVCVTMKLFVGIINQLV
jgi:hypothetical protein